MTQTGIRKSPRKLAVSTTSAQWWMRLEPQVELRRPSQAPKADLSKLDRYAHGGNAYQQIPPIIRDSPLGLAGVGLVGGAYEASKALPAYFGDAVAAGTDPTYAHDANTSKPSLGNWLNLMRGYADAQQQGQAGYLRSLIGKGK
jgi:hypothetical protein